MATIHTNPKAERAWIKDRLAEQGYTQRDLARAWGISEASVTRFLQGTESSDPAFSRAVRLAEMMRISLDDLAGHFGLKGKVPLPAPTSAAPEAPRLGTVSTTPVGGGRLRVVLHLDLPAAVAAELIGLLGKAEGP
jgi:transcriptional regulator with XRE-family HTH domain